MPELFTSLLNEEVNNFVQSIALPQHKYSICETEVDKHPLGHVVSLHLLILTYSLILTLEETLLFDVMSISY